MSAQQQLVPDEPNFVVSSDIYEDRVTFERRKEIWQSCGLVPTLTMASKLMAGLDLALIDNSWGKVEKSWSYGLSDRTRGKVQRRLNKGHTVLSPFGMVQCIKEIIQYADPEKTNRLSIEEFAPCVLGVNEDVDLNSYGNPESWADLHDDFTLSAIAEQSATHSATIATLTADANEIWRRPWPADTPPGVVVDLGDGPAAMFKEAMGVEIDDMFALGLLIFNKVHTGKRSRIERSFFTDDAKVPDDLMGVFLKHCALPISELRELLRVENSGEIINPWVRYTLQQYPFAVLGDGSILVLRLQYALQRFFGEVVNQEVRWILNGCSRAGTTKGKHFSHAMDHVFEYRVGEVLRRITQYHGGGGTIITEPEMNEAWETRRHQNDEICDWGYLRDDALLLIDANKRNLLKELAEGTAAIGILDEDLKKKYKKKFSQLVSTIKQFRATGWNNNGSVVTDTTKFIPLVLAPDEGMAVNEMTQLRILEIAMPMIVELGGQALPPGIITWRELLILDGLAEKRQAHILRILAQWRFQGSDGSTLATSLQRFLESQPGVGALLFSTHHRKAASDFLEYIRERGFRWTLVGMTDEDAQRELNKFHALTGPIRT